MKRWSVALALLAVVAAVIVAVALARTSRPAAPAGGLTRLIAQVRTRFGDKIMVSAKVTGSTLWVGFATPRAAAAQQKGAFEAGVLAGAVADWQRHYGEKPIVTIRYPGGSAGVRYPNGKAIRGASVPPSAGISTLSAGRCRSAGEASVRSLYEDARVASVTQLPYLNGACVIHIRTADIAAVAQAAVPRINAAIDDKNGQRALYIEFDDLAGTPQAIGSYLPQDAWGYTDGGVWAAPDVQPSPFRVP